MSDPINIAQYGHRFQVFIDNTTTAGLSEIVADRIQSAEVGVDARVTTYKELGRKGPVGSSQEPSEFRITLEDNLHGVETDALMAGYDPSTVTSFNAGDFLDEEYRICIANLDNDDDTNVSREYVFSGAKLETLTYTFQVGGACTTRYELRATSGCVLTGGSVIHSTFGTLDDSSPGGIDGKDARIFFGSSGSDARAYRLQRFTITTRWPTEPVRELGRRALVGTMQQPPEVTVDFDLLAADEQPHDVFTSGGDFTDFNEIDVYIRVYDPDLDEAASAIKSFKLENCRPNSVTPISASVNGLATMRYSMQVAKEDTTNSGGLIVYNGDIS